MIHELLCLPEKAPERRAFEDRLLRLDNRLAVLVEEIKDLVRRRDLFLHLVGALRTYPNLADFEGALAEGLKGLLGSFLDEAAEAFKSTPLAKQWGLDQNPDRRLFPRPLESDRLELL